MDTSPQAQNNALSGILQNFQATNPAQSAAISQINSAFAPPPTPYTPPSATSVSSLTSPQTPVSTGIPPSGGITLQDIQNLTATPTQAETTAQNAETNTQNTLQTLMSRLGNQGQEQANLESQVGLPQMNQTLNDLTNQMNTVNAQLGQTKIDAMGRLVPMFQQSAEEQAAQRQASAQLLGLSASANAIKGNIATAQTQVQNALKAEFDPINTQIKYWQNVLTQNRADMTAAQKQKADTITKALAQYNAQIKQQQAEKSAVYTVMLDAAKNGADAATLAKIQAAPDKASAVQAAGSSLQTPASIKVGAGIAGNVPGVTTSGSSDTLQGMLNYYQTTGKLPAFGLSANNPLRAQFYAALGSSSGTNIAGTAATNQSIRAGLTTAYKTQQNQYSANQTSISTLNKQLSLAQQYSNQVSRSDSPLINKYLIAARTGVFGDPQTAALNNIVTTASYEFAKILSGASASIAGTTVTSAADAKNLLNSAMSKGQFNEVLGLMEKEANYRLDSQKQTIAQIQSDMNNVGTLAQQANQTQDNTSQSTLPQQVQDVLKNNVTIEGTNAYIPRAVWSTLGSNMDAVLAEAKADGYTLLIR